MKCYYCSHQLKEVSVQRRLGTGVTPAMVTRSLECSNCATYHDYVDDQLNKIDTIISIREKNYIYRVRLTVNTAALLTLPTLPLQTEVVFVLNHIPDWTPDNVTEKVSNLLAFA
jgi:hypothetical protein